MAHTAAPRWWRRVVLTAPACLLSVVMATTGVTAAADALSCPRGPATATTTIGTGLSPRRGRVLYRPATNTAHLPTGDVIWLDDTPTPVESSPRPPALSTNSATPRSTAGNQLTTDSELCATGTRGEGEVGDGGLELDEAHPG